MERAPPWLTVAAEDVVRWHSCTIAQPFATHQGSGSIESLHRATIAVRPDDKSHLFLDRGMSE
jgi:hypothetical protein